MYEKHKLWKPTYCNSDFKISLDYDFALEMSRINLPQNERDTYNEMISGIFQINTVSKEELCCFFNSSALISSINLENNSFGLYADENLEILLNDQIYSNKRPPILYNSYNVDNYNDAFELIKLFWFWIEFAHLFKKKELSNHFKHS
jgi:hypothetical protein